MDTIVRFATPAAQYVVATTKTIAQELFPDAQPVNDILTIKTGLQYAITDVHVNALYALKKNCQASTTSHKDTYIVIKLAQELGIPQYNIIRCFMAQVMHFNWPNLQDPEYLLLIRDELEELVDIKRFIFESKAPFAHLSSMLDVPEYADDPVRYIGALQTYLDMHFELMIDGNNREITARVNELNRLRSLEWQSFMINPHAENMAGYFAYSPSHEEQWSCEGIAANPMPELGATVLAAQEVAKDRFHRFTKGFFLKAPNPSCTTFPFKNVAFAGGSITKMLCKDYDPDKDLQSDCDMFVFGRDVFERARIFEEVLKWFDTPNTYYAVRGSVTSIYIKDIQRKFQVISMCNSNPFEVIGNFDMTHISWTYLNGTFYGTPSACRAMREKMTRFNNVPRLRVTRLIKALYNGYSIRKDINVIDITEILADKDRLEKHMMELFGWYYPTSTGVPNERRHIMRMIEQDSSATFVSDDVEKAIENVTISGNFMHDYESISHHNLNINSLILPRVVHRYCDYKFKLRTKNGLLRVISGMLEAARVTAREDGVYIEAKVVEKDFMTFVTLIEDTVVRLYTGAPRIDKKILTEDGILKLKIPRFKLNTQLAQERSMMRSQRGIPLNVEEDLGEGDLFKIMFSIVISRIDGIKSVELVVHKVIKYCEEEKKEPPAPREAPVAVEYDGTINYSDE